jgi:hypothetical protein
VGGGLAVFHGITHLRKPQIPDHPGWNYAVLAIAAAFEFYSWRISYRELTSLENRTARRHKACGPPGGLFGIDQEVVTLRGLYGNSGILTDLRQADPILIHR